MKTRIPFAALALLAAATCDPLCGADEKVTPESAQETSPSTPLAVVLGRKLTAAQRDDIQRLITSALFDDLVKTEHLEPTKEELKQFEEKMAKLQQRDLEEAKASLKTLLHELRPENKDLTAEERRRREETAKTLQTMVTSMQHNADETAKEDAKKPTPGADAAALAANREYVLGWKISRTLFHKYGGRVMFQQAGPEPVDAYKSYFKERQAKGDLKFLDPATEAAFWEPFDQVPGDSDYSPEDAKKVMETPFWMKDTPLEE